MVVQPSNLLIMACHILRTYSKLVGQGQEASLSVFLSVVACTFKNGKYQNVTLFIVSYQKKIEAKSIAAVVITVNVALIL